MQHHQEPANAQQTFSSSRDLTVWCTIPVLEFMQEAWENMAKHEKFDEVSGAIEVGLENLRKWYRKVDDTNAYFICLGELMLSHLSHLSNSSSFSIKHLIPTSNWHTQKTSGMRITTTLDCIISRQWYVEIYISILHTNL
jgi:hypothetical protein